jgi:hypothetical protein
VLPVEQRRDDLARIALAAALGEEGNDIHRAHKSSGAQRHVADIAGADADPIERPALGDAGDRIERGHSRSLARALTAAAAMALPPLRPRTIT